MAAWIEKILDQLLVRVWSLLAGKVSAQIELELAATQADLLEQAAAWRRDHAEIGDVISRRLEATSERIGGLSLIAGGGAGDPGNVAARQEFGIRGNGEHSDHVDKRPRGRPKKNHETADHGPLFPSPDLIVPKGEVTP